MFDPGKTDDGVDESRLLGAAVHQIGVRYLHRAGSAMITQDRLGALGCLLSVGRRESLGLYFWCMSVEE
jgi:hypothetical protein